VSALPLVFCSAVAVMTQTGHGKANLALWGKVLDGSRGVQV
jgi:hypothetical protein